MIRYFSFLLLIVSTLNCHWDGYHSMGRFPDRLTAEQKMVEHLVNKYDDLGKGDYKLLYQFDKAKQVINYAIWYDKEYCRLGIENDIYSGPCCVWANVDKAVLQDLVAEGKGIIKASSLSGRIYPEVGPCNY